MEDQSVKKWVEEVGQYLNTLLESLAGKGQEEEKAEKKQQKKPLTIREIGLPRMFLMLLAGLVLLILTFPDFFANTAQKEPQRDSSVIEEDSKDSVKALTSTELDAYVENAENRLKVLLRKVDGVGEVEVMITVKATGESIPLKDAPYEKSTEELGGDSQRHTEKVQEGTVMVEQQDGTSQPYVVMETVPQIEGVAVIAEGGGSSEVKKEIVEAVQVLFDIQAHKIKVMKMNQSTN